MRQRNVQTEEQEAQAALARAGMDASDMASVKYAKRPGKTLRPNGKKTKRRPPAGPPNWLLAILIGGAFSVLGYQLYKHHFVPNAIAIHHMVENDLHGIHDLLLVGVSGVFLWDAERQPAVSYTHLTLPTILLV